MSDEVIAIPDLDETRVVYEKLVDGTGSVEDICRSDALYRIKDRLLKHLNTIDIYILRKFVRAESTGNWALHIQPIKDMPHYIAALGHNLYTKSVRVYLQQMAIMKEEHPDVHPYVDRVAHVSKNRLLVGRSVIGSNH